MNEVSPELAAKVLAASKRNVVKKVGDGGTLTSAEAGDFEAATLSPETARDVRAQALLVKWATAGRLTGAEERELESYFPGVIARCAGSAIPDLGEPLAPEGGFILQPEPVRSTVTKQQLAVWSQRYDNTSHRQIRRWIEDGLKANDPCPLDDPPAFAQWWVRRRIWKVPDWLLSLAKETVVVSPPPSDPASVPPASESPVVQTPAGAVPAPNFEAVHLKDYELGEGQAVVQQRRIVAAIYAQLERAYLTPGGDSDVIQRKYNNAVEGLRKLEKDDREDRKQRGQLISRAAVQQDIETATELMRQMADSESRRVQELVPGLTTEQAAALDTAIKTVTEARARVFRNLKSLKTTAAAVLALNAA